MQLASHQFETKKENILNKYLRYFQKDHFIKCVVIGNFLMTTHIYLPVMKAYYLKSCQFSIWW